MRARYLNKDAFAALAMVVSLGGLASVAVGGPAGEKIQFSEVPATATGPVVVSNLNRLAPTEGSFKQVKEDLLRPFGSLTGKSLEMESFMDNQMPLPQRQTRAPMSKHTIELLDQRRNWAFTSYQELFSPQDDSEKKMFGIKEYGDDGREKKPSSIVDKYYDGLGSRNLSATNQTAEEVRAEFINRNGFDPLGNSFHSGENFTQAAFRKDEPPTAADTADQTMLMRTAGLAGLRAGVPGESAMPQKRLSELDQIRKSILGSGALPLRQPGSEGLSVDDYYSDKTKSAADKLLSEQMADPTGARAKSGNQFIVADPTANVLHSHINDDLTAKALGLPNPVAAATNSYVRPTAQSVESELDPFGANRMKRKF